MSCQNRRAVTRDPQAAAGGPVSAAAVPPTTLASDAERERIVGQLRAAHGEGRLDYPELEERTAAAYRARTHGDLAVLTADLPPAPVEAAPEPSPAKAAKIALTASWSAWAVAVAINVVIWALVSLGAAEAVYFWPIWVAGPWGAVLVVTSIATMVAIPRTRR